MGLGWGRSWEWGHQRLPHWFLGYVLCNKDLWNQLHDPNFAPQIPRERVDCCCSHLGLWMAEISVLSSPTCPSISYRGSISLLFGQEDFFNYISTSENDVLTEAISNFNRADMDELISILSSHNCCVLPTEENLPSLVEEMAHKEMVQEPALS